MNVLIIGGNGFFGSKLREEISKDHHFVVESGGRNKMSVAKTVIVDLNDFENAIITLVKFDVIINTAEPPIKKIIERLVHWVVNNNKLFIETTASIEHTLQFLDLERTYDNLKADGKGKIIFGAGVFPGLSNLMVSHHITFYPDQKNIILGLRYSIFSGAGKGMCKLMSKTLTEPSKWLINSKLEKGPPVAQQKKMVWKDGPHPSMQVYLADLEYYIQPPLLSSFETYLSLKPDWLNYTGSIFNLIPSNELIKDLMTKWFFLLRGKLFGKRRTDLEILVHDGTHRSILHVSDAFASGGISIAMLVSKYRLGGVFQGGGIYRFNSLITIEEIHGLLHKNELWNIKFQLTHE